MSLDRSNQHTEQHLFYLPLDVVSITTIEIHFAIQFIMGFKPEDVYYKTIDEFSKIYSKFSKMGDLLRNFYLKLLPITVSKEFQELSPEQIQHGFKPFSDFKDMVGDVALKAYGFVGIMYTNFLKNNKISEYDRLTFDANIETILFHADNFSKNYCKISDSTIAYTQVRKILSSRLANFKNEIPEMKLCASEMRATINYEDTMKLLESAYTALQLEVDESDKNKIMPPSSLAIVKIDNNDALRKNSMHLSFLLEEFANKYLITDYIDKLNSDETVSFLQKLLAYLNKTVNLLLQLKNKIEDTEI